MWGGLVECGGTLGIAIVLQTESHTLQTADKDMVTRQNRKAERRERLIETWLESVGQ